MVLKYKQGTNYCTITDVDNIVYLDGSNKFYIDYRKYTKHLKLSPSEIISIK